MGVPDCHIFTIGDVYVGKTTYLRHYFYGASSCFNSATIGADEFSKTIQNPDGTSLTFCFWDTAGQERYHSLTPSFYKHKRSGLILMFSLTDESTLENCLTWYEAVTKNSPLGSDLPTVLIGNKKDLVEARRVPEEDIENMARKLKAKYFLISSITGENMKESLNYICHLVGNLPSEECAIPLSNLSAGNENDNCWCVRGD